MTAVFDRKVEFYNELARITLATELQEKDDRTFARKLQTELSPPKRKAVSEPEIASTGKDAASAHCLSPEGSLMRKTRRLLGY